MTLPNKIEIIFTTVSRPEIWILMGNVIRLPINIDSLKSDESFVGTKKVNLSIHPFCS